MVAVRGFEFSLTEFAGALGDFGLLNPFIIAYIAVLGLNPAGILLAMGFVNIVAGLIYKLPLSVEPMKATGMIALNQGWSPSMVYGTGIGMGLVWLGLGFSGVIKKIAKVIPICVIVGVQLGLALLLLQGAAGFMWTNVALAAVGIALVLMLIKNRYLPAGIAIFTLGLVIAFATNPSMDLKFGFYVPDISIPSAHEMAAGLLLVGFAQIVLTLSNAVLATSMAVNERFPKRGIKAESLAKSTGVVNTALPFVGGVPMCHGAGGFAAQYFFGARTGGAMLMEGTLEIFLAFFLAGSVASIFGAFPLAIIGVMLLFAGIELGKFLLTVKRRVEITIALAVGVVSFFTNLGIGFVVGLLIFYSLRRYACLKPGKPRALPPSP